MQCLLVFKHAKHLGLRDGLDFPIHHTVLHVLTEQRVSILGVFGIDVHDLRRELLLPRLVILGDKGYHSLVPVVAILSAALDDVRTQAHGRWP